MILRQRLASATLLLGAFLQNERVQGQDYAMSFDVPSSPAVGETFQVRLLGTSNAPSPRGLAGFAALFEYDPSALELVSTSFAGSVWAASDFQSVQDNAGTVGVGVVHDDDGVAPPSATIVAAGVDLVFLTMTFVAPNCPNTTAIGFVGGIDDNLLADENLEGHDPGNGLALSDVSIQVDGGGSFVRGNARGDPVAVGDPGASVDLADGMFLLQHLFLAGAAPPCLDAADANDDGRLNLLDPMWIFQFVLGNEGPTLPEPYTSVGSDPTADALGCASTPLLQGC